MKMDTGAAFEGAPDKDVEPVFQVAALCLRNEGDAREVLLVTSSENRWILPKGWPMKGKTDAEAAKIEAWEEAGVRGAASSDRPIARIKTIKQYSDGRVLPCILDVYDVDVETQKDDFPEAAERDRKWVSLSQAAQLVEDTALRKFLRDLDRSAA